MPRYVVLSSCIHTGDLAGAAVRGVSEEQLYLLLGIPVPDLIQLTLWVSVEANTSAWSERCHRTCSGSGEPAKTAYCKIDVCLGRHSTE